LWHSRPRLCSAGRRKHFGDPSSTFGQTRLEISPGAAVPQERQPRPAVPQSAAIPQSRAQLIQRLYEPASSAGSGTCEASEGCLTSEPPSLPGGWQAALCHLQHLAAMGVARICSGARAEALSSRPRHEAWYDGRRRDAGPRSPDFFGTDGLGNTYGLSQLLGGIKGASAHRVNRALGRKGHVWQDESFDHVVRCDETFEKKRSTFARIR
jgi:hypothetical protein